MYINMIQFNVNWNFISWGVSDSFIKIANILETMGRSEKSDVLHEYIWKYCFVVNWRFKNFICIKQIFIVHSFLMSAGESLEKARKLEARVATDTDLKLSGENLCKYILVIKSFIIFIKTDCLRYFMRDTQAAKDLLYRRLRCLANYEGANKNLERCRAKNRDVPKVMFQTWYIIKNLWWVEFRY